MSIPTIQNYIRLFNLTQQCHFCLIHYQDSHKVPGTCNYNHQLCQSCYQKLTHSTPAVCNCSSSYHSASCQYGQHYPSCLICFAIEHRRQIQPPTVLQLPYDNQLVLTDLTPSQSQAVTHQLTITQLLTEGLKAKQKLQCYQEDRKQMQDALHHLRNRNHELQSRLSLLEHIKDDYSQLQTQYQQLKAQVDQQSQEHLQQLQQQVDTLKSQLVDTQEQLTTCQQELDKQTKLVEQLSPIQKILIPSESIDNSLAHLQERLKELNHSCLICLENKDVFHYGLTACCNAIICLDCQSKISRLICPSCRQDNYRVRPLSIYEKRLIQTLLIGD